MTVEEVTAVINRIYLDVKKTDQRYGKYFDKISIGFQRADHEIFTRLGDVIPGHIDPRRDIEEFQGQTVISYSISFKPLCRQSQDGKHPSLEWTNASLLFRQFTNEINRRIEGSFPEWKFVNLYNHKLYDREISEEKIDSNWSERHVAYACGLGTFGRHYSIITENGSCHRLCSLISDLELTDIQTPIAPLMGNCLSHRGIECRRCMNNCPVGAISSDGKDLWKCYLYEDIHNGEYIKEKYHMEMACCGLCMINTPCETGIPMYSSRRV